MPEGIPLSERFDFLGEEANGFGPDWMTRLISLEAEDAGEIELAGRIGAAPWSGREIEAVAEDVEKGFDGGFEENLE